MTSTDPFPLTFYAGSNALEIIKRDGFGPEKVKVIAGAAGGPKWLVTWAARQAVFFHSGCYLLPSRCSHRVLHRGLAVCLWGSKRSR